MLVVLKLEFLPEFVYWKTHTLSFQLVWWKPFSELCFSYSNVVWRTDYVWRADILEVFFDASFRAEWHFQILYSISSEDIAIKLPDRH